MMNLEQEKRLAKTSRRKPGNEATLLWMTLGIIFYYGIIAIGYRLKSIDLVLNPFGLNAGIAIILSGILAFCYYKYISKKVHRAAVEYNLFMRHKQQKIKAAHIEKMKQNQIFKKSEAS